MSKVQQGSSIYKEPAAYVGNVQPGSETERERIRSFVNSEIYKEDDEQLSYLKLKRHIQLNHPTDKEGHRYGVCSEIGYLPCCNGCFRMKYNRQKKRDEIEITRIQ